MSRLRKTLLSLEPHPSSMYNLIENELPSLEDFVGQPELSDHFAGMSTEQVSELASDPRFSVGVHTTDHPFLSKCDEKESYAQMLDNKNWLEKLSNQFCKAIAYPAGDYDARILRQCQHLLLESGHALIPTLGAFPEQELARVGVYSDSYASLGFKVQWGNWVRSAQAALGQNRSKSSANNKKDLKPPVDSEQEDGSKAIQ